MKRLEVLSTMMLLCFAIMAVGSSRQAHAQEEWQSYSNEYFSMEYPSDWCITFEDVQGVPDSFGELGDVLTQSIRVGFTSEKAVSDYEGIIVQKSSMGEELIREIDSPQQWRNLSIMGKQFEDSYVDLVEEYMLDSLTFNGQPAAMVGFVAVTDDDSILATIRFKNH